MADGVTGEFSETTEEQDGELDDLLDSALEDFDKTDNTCKPKEPLAPKAPANKPVENSTKGGTSTQNNEELFEKIFGEGDDSDEEKLEETVKKLLGGNEDLMRQLNQFTEAATAAGNSQGASIADLETQLKRTMEDLAQNTKDMGEAGVDDDFLRAMSDLGLGDGNEGGGMDFLQVMQGMMQNLLSKDVLYPALKELNEKYPAWLENRKSTLKDEEYARYKKQYELVQQICKEYESETAQETETEKAKRFNKMMELMQKMQESGNPPSELLHENPVQSPEVPLDLPPVKPGEECKPM